MALLKRKRAGLSDPMTVVTTFVNACNRHDADAIFSCLHPNFDSIQPMYPSRNFRGADQVRRNWQAIFDAEPGFRLTVLRSAVQDDIVWLELHGAGRDAEVAGVFVMGIQGDRIRWARIYSALVEAVPGAADDGAQAQAAGGNGEVGSGAIAPVVDLERSGRRRRRSRRGEPAPAAPPVGEEPVAEAPAATEPDPDPGGGREPDAVAAAEPRVETLAMPDPAPAPDFGPAAEAQAEPEVLVVVGPDQEPEKPVPPPVAEAGPPAEPTAAHDMVTQLEPEGHSDPAPEPETVVLTTEPEAVPEATAGPEAVPEATAEPDDDEPPKWRFGKKGR